MITADHKITITELFTCNAIHMAEDVLLDNPEKIWPAGQIAAIAVRLAYACIEGN